MIPKGQYLHVCLSVSSAHEEVLTQCRRTWRPSDWTVHREDCSP